MKSDRNDIMIHALIVQYITDYRRLAPFARFLMLRKIKKLVKEQSRNLEIRLLRMNKLDYVEVNNLLFKYIIDYGNAIGVLESLRIKMNCYNSIVLYSHVIDRYINKMVYRVTFHELNHIRKNWTYISKENMEIHLVYSEYRVRDDDDRRSDLIGGGSYDIIYNDDNIQNLAHLTRLSNNINIVNSITERIIVELDRATRYLKRNS